MKRILLPIDGSECALRAVALAIAERALYRDPDDLEIHLVSVQLPFSNDISRFVSHDHRSAVTTRNKAKERSSRRALCSLRPA